MKPVLSKDEKKGLKLVNDRLRNLRPDPDGEVAFAGKIMNETAKKLQTLHPFNFAEFKMIGSLKKKTQLTSRKEFDMVISLPNNKKTNYTPTNESRIELKHKIADFFAVKVSDEGRQNVQIIKSGWKIDILPTFKIDILDFLKKTKEEKRVYKPHMSILHVKFVTDRGNIFQDFCRLAKYWTNGPEYIKDRYPYASSWFIELIAAIVFDDSLSNSNLVNLFEGFLRRVKNLKTKKRIIAFSNFYNINKYKELWTDKLSVIDPTDPEDNLATRGIQKIKLNELTTRAKETLELWENKGFNILFQTYFSRNPS